MFKSILTAIAAIGVASPAFATPEYLNRQHSQLWETLESVGVGVYLNPREVCNKPKAPMGFYYYNSRMGKPLLAVCQDNRDYTGAEVAWTDNDLDTLRHEAVHFIQDCVDGRVDGTLDPYFDGPGPSPGTLTHRDVVRRLGYSRASRIANTYAARGADLNVIRLEHEAFAVATYGQASDISDKIRQVCPTPNR